MNTLFDYGIPGLLVDLPADLAKALDETAVKMTFADGQQIHSRGDRMQSLSIVKSGAARLGFFDIDGDYRITAIFGPGQFFGEFTIFAGLPREFDAVAIGPTIIHEVSRIRFDRLIDQNRGLREHFLSSLAFRLHAALEFIDDLRRLPLTLRLAKVLLHAARSETGQERVGMTQSELGDILGVTRISVNKSLKELEGLGLLSRAYGEITLPDPQALKRWVRDRTIGSGAV